MTLWDQKETLSPDILLQNCLCQLYLNCAFCHARFLLFFFFFPLMEESVFQLKGMTLEKEASVMMKQEGGRICHGKNSSKACK